MSLRKPVSRSVIVIVGGDARQGHRLIRGVRVRAVASAKHGGAGEHRALIATIRSGSVQLVLLLVRWLGHPESHAITATCRTVGVPCLVVTGGVSAAWALADREVARG